MLDLDNTLGNRTAAVQQWIAEFVEDWALPGDAASWIERQDNDGYSARHEVFAAVQERYEIPASVDALLTAYQDRVIQLAAPAVGAIECLDGIRSAGHTIAIVSNGSTRQQHGKIDSMGLRSLVDAVIVSGDLGIKKPDVRIFHAAANATGSALAGSWMVGDSAMNDVVGGHRVGAKTAWIRRNRSWTETECEPTVVLDSLVDLADALVSHG